MTMIKVKRNKIKTMEKNFKNRFCQKKIETKFQNIRNKKYQYHKKQYKEHAFEMLKGSRVCNKIPPTAELRR